MVDWNADMVRRHWYALKSLTIETTDSTDTELKVTVTIRTQPRFSFNCDRERLASILHTTRIAATREDADNMVAGLTNSTVTFHR